jgi:hypothetical protein
MFDICIPNFFFLSRTSGEVVVERGRNMLQQRKEVPAMAAAAAVAFYPKNTYIFPSPLSHL